MDESVIKHLEQPKVGTLKLSEAIRIGARIRPQCTDTMLYSRGTSCALGAAYEAVFGVPPRNTDSSYKRLTKRFPELYWKVEGCALMEHVTGYNDSFRWTREQIADWLEERGY